MGCFALCSGLLVCLSELNLLGAAGDKTLPPRTPQECRRETLTELRRFRDQERPEPARIADEHIDRAIIGNFRELKERVFFLLISAGDAQSLETAIRTYDLENRDDEAWHKKHITGASQPLPKLSELAAALQTQRPDLAKRIRERILLAKRLEREHQVRILERTPVAELSLEELNKEAMQPEGWGARRHESIVRWAQLEPKESTPWLLKQFEAKEVDINIQFTAAKALALLGHEQGFNFLQQAALGNLGLGGAPGAALLDAGERGERIYFRLVQECEQKRPGEALPYGLGTPSSCSENALFRNLDRLLQIKAPNASTAVRFAIEGHELPSPQLSIVIEYLRRNGYDDSYLCSAVQRSLIEKPPKDFEARLLARIWVDQLLGSNLERQWAMGLNIFIEGHLGTREIAATAARRHLSDGDVTRLACRILGEAGKAEDSVIIWQATHRPLEEKKFNSHNWYAGPSDGWNSIMRLTNHLLD